LRFQGPSFAEEVASNQPTAIVAASLDAAARDAVQQAFSHGNFRVYTNDDLVGVELGGAAKNTLALAAGMCAGLGLGSNSVAALITRGLAEMTRLALAYGAKPETLTGLAGLGDLVLTCTGRLSRNRHVGEELGRGRTLDDILDRLTETAEGVRTTLAVRELAARRRIEMPITEQVYRVLYESAPVADAIGELMGRPLTTEFGGRQGV
jgi:glycerol-3-phosphate dehydrogenase (NAD(P)+)